MALFAPLLSNDGTLKERLEDLKKMFTVNPLVKQAIEFINCGSDRSFLRPNASVSCSIESPANDKAHGLGWFETAMNVNHLKGVPKGAEATKPTPDKQRPGRFLGPGWHLQES
jgi:hypothetical protein